MRLFTSDRRIGRPNNGLLGSAGGSLLLVAMLVACTPCLYAGEELVLTDRREAEAQLLQFTFPTQPEETLRMEHQGENATYASQKLVRWGHPAERSDGIAVRLIDGSLLVSSTGWALEEPLQFDAQHLLIRREGQEWHLDRRLVQSVTFVSKDPATLENRPEVDQVFLAGGDRLVGDLESFADETLSIRVEGTMLEVPAERLVKIVLRQNDRHRLDNASRCWVGLHDGTLLHASHLQLTGTKFQATTLGGFELTGSASEVLFVQPLTGSVAYLSDSLPLDYRHTPYFALAWPWGKDTLPRGEPLRLGTERFAKGIAMHSASRLVFPVVGNPRRFQADLVLAHTQRGSVQASVLLIRGGQLETLFQSDVIRGDAPPQAIDLEVVDAEAIVLTVDYADGADVGDDALWLDARWVYGSAHDEK